MYIIIVNLNTKMLADFSIKSVIAKLHNFLGGWKLLPLSSVLTYYLFTFYSSN